MDNIKPSFRGAVYAIFKKEDKILLIKRKNTTWYDGFYSLPAGRLSKNEYPTSGIIREVLEEVGVKIKKEDLEPVYFAARHDNRNGVPISTYFEVFFIIKKWEG